MSTWAGESLSTAVRSGPRCSSAKHVWPPRRIGQRDGAVDADHAHREVARLRQALHIQPVERVDGQTGHLHEGQTDQKHQRGARGETARPKAEFSFTRPALFRARPKRGGPILRASGARRRWQRGHTRRREPSL